MTRVWRRLTLGVAVATMATACTSDPPDGTPAATTPPPEPEPASTDAWTLAGYTPASSVRAIEDGFVLYALDGGDRLHVIGIEAETGQVRWQHQANHSFIIGGVGMSVAVNEELAVFLTTARDEHYTTGRVEIAAVDPVTGELRWSEPALHRVTSNPSFCGEDGELICAVGWRGDDRRWVALDPQDGRVRGEASLDDGRTVGPQLHPANDSNALVRIESDGSRAWLRPVRELFGGVAVNPDFGWTIRNDDGRYVGWLGTEWDPGPGDAFQLDLGEQVIAAFDEATGEPLWAEVGTFACGRLSFSLDPPVRCRSEGVWTRDADWEEYQFEDGVVTIEGFDPATGEPTWSWDAGDVPGLVFPHESVRRFDDTSVLVAVGAEEFRLDLVTGDRQPVTEQLASWCADQSWVVPSPRVSDRSSNELAVPEHWPCLADGSIVELPMTTPEFAGAQADGVFAWVEESRLRAVTVADDAD